MDFLRETIFPHVNFYVYVVIMMIGLFAMISKNNLIKKLIGMSIFQTAIILFYVSLSVKTDANIPIIEHGPGHAVEEFKGGRQEFSYDDLKRMVEERAYDDRNDVRRRVVHRYDDSGNSLEPIVYNYPAAANPDDFANPLPHVLMLTAIVVGVATLGVGLAISQLLFQDYGTLEEDEIIAKIEAEGRGHG